jgi:hypothetical protein
MDKTSMMTPSIEKWQKSYMIISFVKMFMSSFLYLGMAWMLLWVANDGNCYIWNTGLVLGGVSVILLLLLLIFINSIRRAYQYHLILFVYYLIFIIGVFEASAKIVLHNFGFQGGIVIILLGIISVMISFVLNFKIHFLRLDRAWKYNVQSACFQANSAEWDLSKEIKFDSPKGEEKEKRVFTRIGRFAPLAPGIGMLLSRNLADRALETVLSGLLYFIGVFVFLGIQRQLSLSLYLLKRERLLGQAIYLVTEK